MNRSLLALELALAASLSALLLASCPARAAPPKAESRALPAGETAGDSKGLDPRSAFEGSNAVGGLPASIEKAIPLVPSSGYPEAGASLALGGPLSVAAIARGAGSGASTGGRHELVLASGARLGLPGPVLAMAATGDRLVLSCADPAARKGSILLGLKIEGEGESLSLSWRRNAPPARRMIAAPGGRVALVEDEATEPESASRETRAGPRLVMVDAAAGTESWAVSPAARAVDAAYAPGLVLSIGGTSLQAFDEGSGKEAWSASLPALASSLAAGSGLALVAAENGSLLAFSLADGKGIGASPGPFDAGIRPVADGQRAIAALPGGGAEELDVKSGTVLRSWHWSGQASFLIADRERIYAGTGGGGSGGLFIAPRGGDEAPRLIPLPAQAFDLPIALPGARGGLVLLLQDGSLVLVGAERASAPGAASPLEAALAPPAQAASAMAEALQRFKPSGGTDRASYLRFDVFAQGVPVELDAAFTAYRYEAPASGKRIFFLSPAAPAASGAADSRETAGAVAAVFAADGRLLESSVDEVGAGSRVAAALEKGKPYWIAAGWAYQAEPARLRLYAK
jgi:hypothetical protein